MTDEPEQTRERAWRRPDVRLGAVLAIAVAAGVSVWLVTGGGSEQSARTTGPTGSATRQAASRPAPATAAGLNTLATALRHPIYWAGPLPGRTYELTRASDGSRIFIRYLPRGTRLGTRRDELTVGTYAVQGAFDLTAKVARRPGSVTIPLTGGGIAVYSSNTPTNIYLAFPGVEYQVEVYDPSAAEARQLVASGRIAPVSAAASARSVSLGTLEALAGTFGHPVYWVGPVEHTKYEVTQTADGRFYVRYLPFSATTGTTQAFLVVGTYPVTGAFAIAQRAAGAHGNVHVSVAKGGVAFYNVASSTNIFVAFPGSDYEVEVYNPSASRAKQLVASGSLAPIP